MAPQPESPPSTPSALPLGTATCPASRYSQTSYNGHGPPLKNPILLSMYTDTEHLLSGDMQFSRPKTHALFDLYALSHLHSSRLGCTLSCAATTLFGYHWSVLLIHNDDLPNRSAAKLLRLGLLWSNGSTPALRFWFERDRNLSLSFLAGI